MTTNSTSLAVIQRIVVALAHAQNDVVDTNLQLLPLNKIDEATVESLSGWFLEQAFKVNNVEGARIVVNVFNIQRANIDELPAITKLLLNTVISREALRFVLEAFPTRTAVAYYLDLLNSTNDAAAIKAVTILDTIMPTMPYEHWRLLLETIADFMDTGLSDEQHEFHLPLFKALIETKAAEADVSVTRPTWVRELPAQPLPVCPRDFPTVKDAIVLLITDLRAKKLVIDDVNDDTFQNNIISQYCISTMKEKYTLLNNIVPGIPEYDDIAVFQELGPVNSQFTHHTHLLEASKCTKYGGCRMFTCTEHETIDEQGDDCDIMDSYIITDWFRGSCDQCLRRIDARHYAVRQPLLHGGWRGCYCSIACVEQVLSSKHEAIMVGRMKEQLEVLGIRHR